MAESREAPLVRAIGVRGLAATTFNIVVGGGIFVVPAVAASGLGAAAPVAYLVCAAIMGLIALCMAEAGSRVARTGGPYAYVEAALGGFVGFLAGVLLWLLATLATAAVASVFASSVAVFAPALGGRAGRAAVLVSLFVVLALVNVRGVRQGTRLVELVTVAKLLPLVLFVAAGALFVRADYLAWDAVPSLDRVGRASIGLFFAFAGIESALMPSGEVRDPSRTVPLALMIAMIAVTSLYVAVQIVTQGVLGPELASETTQRGAPLAMAATTFAGLAGGLAMALAATISTLGHATGMTLAAPRALYAFGRQGVLPPMFGAVHPRFRTPHVAIVAQSAIAALLAITSQFAELFVLATVSTLVLYLLCCVSAVVLRRRDVRADGVPFRLPLGPLVPALACAAILWLLTSATTREMTLVAGVLLAAGVVFAARTLGDRTWRPGTEGLARDPGGRGAESRHPDLHG